MASLWGARLQTCVRQLYVPASMAGRDQAKICADGTLPILACLAVISIPLLRERARGGHASRSRLAVRYGRERQRATNFGRDYNGALAAGLVERIGATIDKRVNAGSPPGTKVPGGPADGAQPNKGPRTGLIQRSALQRVPVRALPLLRDYLAGLAANGQSTVARLLQAPPPPFLRPSALNDLAGLCLCR